MPTTGKPVADCTFYFKGGTLGMNRVVELRSQGGRGNTVDTPMFSPSGASPYGIKIDLGNVRDMFYDFHTGECHYYVDGYDIWVTSDDIIRTYGADSGWQVYQYDGTSPANDVEIDAPSIVLSNGHPEYPFETNLYGNAIYVTVWRRRWQVFDFGEWSWDWENVYTAGPYHFEPAPYIHMESDPEGGDVYLGSAYVGKTPVTHILRDRFENRKTFEVKVTKPGYNEHSIPVTLAWPTPTQSSYDSFVRFVSLTYKECIHPEGVHGSIRCSGHDRVQCNAGTWETLETDSPTCGYPKPRAKFSAKWAEGSPPLVVTFTDLSSDNPKSWTWDFGDGTGSSEQNPTHTYTAPGGHLVYLEVANQSGTDSAQATITVKSPCAAPEGDHGDVGCIGYDRARCTDGTWEVFEENSGTCGYPAPVADFSASTVAGYAPLTIQFEDMSTQFPATWAWDFGDGITSDEQHPEHTYETPGDYLVTLTTSNHIGSSHTELAISVQEPEPEPIPILTGQTAQIVGIATMAGVGLYLATRATTSRKR